MPPNLSNSESSWSSAFHLLRRYIRKRRPNRIQIGERSAGTRRRRAPPRPPAAHLLWSETAEQTVLFPVYSGSEIKCIGQTAIAAVAELDAPESVDDNCLTMRVANLID